MSSCWTLRAFSGHADEGLLFSSALLAHPSPIVYTTKTPGLNMRGLHRWYAEQLGHCGAPAGVRGQWLDVHGHNQVALLRLVRTKVLTPEHA